MYTKGQYARLNSAVSKLAHGTIVYTIPPSRTARVAREALWGKRLTGENSEGKLVGEKLTGQRFMGKTLTAETFPAKPSNTEERSALFLGRNAHPQI